MDFLILEIHGREVIEFKPGIVLASPLADVPSQQLWPLPDRRRGPRLGAGKGRTRRGRGHPRDPGARGRGRGRAHAEPLPLADGIIEAAGTHASPEFRVEAEGAEIDAVSSGESSDVTSNASHPDEFDGVAEDDEESSVRFFCTVPSY